MKDRSWVGLKHREEQYQHTASHQRMHATEGQLISVAFIKGLLDEKISGLSEVLGVRWLVPNTHIHTHTHTYTHTHKDKSLHTNHTYAHEPTHTHNHTCTHTHAHSVRVAAAAG